MCTDAYREALTRHLSSTAPSTPAPSQDRHIDAEAGSAGGREGLGPGRDRGHHRGGENGVVVLRARHVQQVVDAGEQREPRPGGPGLSTKGVSTIRPLFDGLFIEERIEGALNGVPFTTLAWTGFNTATRQYEATRIASTNRARIVETGGYDENANQFELKADYSLAGETWHQRTVIQPISADAMVATSYLNFGNVPEWKGVEINYARRSNP